MRPKKKILVVRMDEVSLSILTYSLRINGYIVMAATSPEEAVVLFTRHEFDLVIADIDLKPIDGIELAKQLNMIRGYVAIALLGDPEQWVDTPHYANAILNKKGLQTSELLERARIWTQRKRGPRPASKLILAQPQVA